VVKGDRCPECGSICLYRDGLRYVSEGQIQRYLCRKCGYRFSENSYKQFQTNGNRQLCAILEEAKKLDSATEIKTVVGES